METEVWSGKLSDLLLSVQDSGDFLSSQSDAAYVEAVSNYDPGMWWQEPSIAEFDGFSEATEAAPPAWSECTTLRSASPSPPDLLEGFESTDILPPNTHPPRDFDPSANLEESPARKSPVPEGQASNPECLNTWQCLGPSGGILAENSPKQSDAKFPSYTKRKTRPLSICPAVGCGKSFRSGFKKHLALHKPGRSVHSTTVPDKTASDLYDEMCKDTRRSRHGRKVKLPREAGAEPGPSDHRLVWPTANDAGQSIN